jgi:hypothetical protein
MMIFNGLQSSFSNFELGLYWSALNVFRPVVVDQPTPEIMERKKREKDSEGNVRTQKHRRGALDCGSDDYIPTTPRARWHGNKAPGPFEQLRSELEETLVVLKRPCYHNGSTSQPESA